VPSTRSFAEAGNIIVGVRPEKMRVLDAIDAGTIPDHHNRITGRVTDVSYMGVSTQYLVQTPWEQEVIVFEQNVVVGDRSDVGDEVVVHWSPKHTFGLDGSSGTNVGVDPEVLELEALNVGLLDESPEA
jgi:spermidine/putrescine transport system ATP-binding protein